MDNNGILSALDALEISITQGYRHSITQIRELKEKISGIPEGPLVSQGKNATVSGGEVRKPKKQVTYAVPNSAVIANINNLPMPGTLALNFSIQVRATKDSPSALKGPRLKLNGSVFYSQEGTYAGYQAKLAIYAEDVQVPGQHRWVPINESAIYNEELLTELYNKVTDRLDFYVETAIGQLLTVNNLAEVLTLPE